MKKKDTLKFITCGSVDDGKSTLLGRLLFETGNIKEDQEESLKKLQKKSANNIDLDYSLLLDGLEAEREQKITIDVSYQYFYTENRNFIVGDSPGHEQYTRNMVTAASNADTALILVDAKKGISHQTQRHIEICNLVNLKTITFVINKMDLVKYSENKYKKLVNALSHLGENRNFQKLFFIPASGLKGQNVTTASKKMSWYKGKCLLSHLENLNISKIREYKSNFSIPIQLVMRPSSKFRGYGGRISSGKIEVGDIIKSGHDHTKSKVTKIYLGNKSVLKASRGDSILFKIQKDIDISRGDFVTNEKKDLDSSKFFNVNLFWMDISKGFEKRDYLLKTTNNEINAKILRIKKKIRFNRDQDSKLNILELNDISEAEISLDKEIFYENFLKNNVLGSFILIDKISNLTVAAGTINFALRRSKNVSWQKLNVSKIDRNILNNHSSRAIWLTGISGSGKSTIANFLEKELHKRGLRTYILDGDNLRHGLNKDLGFSDIDRVENIRRAGEVSKLMVDAGIFVICSFISPFRSDREMIRELFEDDEFIEVFVNVDLKTAEKRDPKGLYKKARKGLIKNFTGIDSAYEVPKTPEIDIKNDRISVEKSVRKILNYLKEKNLLD